MAIVGGGSAGLAAGYWLARYRHRVRVFDAGAPRNATAHAVHGYPALPDLTPGEFRRRLREQARGAGAVVVTATVTSVSGEKNAFRVGIAGAAPVWARRILLACGRWHRIPAIPGLAETYGSTSHHCPDCDGPDTADEPAGVIGADRHAAGLALYLLTWTDRVALLLHGRRLAAAESVVRTLRDHDVTIHARRIARVLRSGRRVEGVEFADGEVLALRHLFFHPRSVPFRLRLPRRLDQATDDGGRIVTDAGQETSIPGIYAAGDLTGHPYLAPVAAAEGIRAALAIHRSLLPPDFEL
ncbi:MAG TPA: NAD(P)/FAD-dependent oxidoreductase [Longimicrobiales bacterium]